MKKILFITLFGILLSSCSTKSEKETRNLKRFDKVNIVGNIALHLNKNVDHSIEIKANNTSDLEGLTTEVRNGELFIYNEAICDHCDSPRYIINLNYSEISNLRLTGVIKLISENVISQESLAINGNGIFNGGIDVSVDTLLVNLDGISNMNISGEADTSDLKVTGIGMIRANDLKTKNAKSDSLGIAFIYK